MGNALTGKFHGFEICKLLGRLNEGADSLNLRLEGIARDDSRQESDVSKVIRGQHWRCRIAAFFALALIAAGCARGRDRQTVVVLIESSPANLDPRIGTDAESERIGSLIFDSLLRRDRQGNLLPGLAEQARIARVEFKVVPDATSRALELRKGSADVEFNALTADMVATLAEVKSLGIARAPGESYQYLAFNLENRALTWAVRQAIANGIDREAMIQYLWRGMARPADSVLPPENWAHAQGLAVYPYNPSEARKLMDEAGLHPGPDGVRLRLVMKTSTDQTARELAAALQAQLRKIGVALEIRPFEFATFYADINRGSFDLYSLRWISGNDDPDILSYLFDSRRAPPDGANRGHYTNPEVVGCSRKLEPRRIWRYGGRNTPQFRASSPPIFRTSACGTWTMWRFTTGGSET